MDFLILYIAEGEMFDTELIRELFYGVLEITEIEESLDDGSYIKGRYSKKDNSTIVELKDDLESIALSGIGISAIELAYNMQKYYKERLRVIDSDYNFDLVIKDFDSFKEFQDAIEESIDNIN